MTSSQHNQGGGSGFMSTSRLIELVVVTILSSAIGGGLAAFGTVKVLETEIRNLRNTLAETRQEMKELRNDLYAPRSYRQEEQSRQSMRLEKMKLTDLKTRLNDSLHDAGRVFEDADLDRHIRVALNAMALTKRPRWLSADITLTANQAEYDAPTGIANIDRLVWSNEFSRSPWARKYPGPSPRPALLRHTTGNKIVLTPPPDQQQVNALGGTVKLRYYAKHETTGAGADEEVTTLDESDEDLLILRAQAEAMRELAFRGITKPVEMGGGSLSQPRNGTPAALYAMLMEEFRAAP